MKQVWLNREKNSTLIIFFAGWSFDEQPFKFLEFEGMDVLVIYDYSDTNFDIDFSGYETFYLVAWSMGVYVAALLREVLPAFERVIAFNGTPFPIDNEFGIPNKTFELTLKYAVEGLKGKFYQNVFYDDEQLKRYLDAPVGRSIENRVNELYALKKMILEKNVDASGFFDKAYVSRVDKIIPPKNQLSAWRKLDVPIIELADGHFPFYNFNSWNELCK